MEQQIKLSDIKKAVVELGEQYKVEKIYLFGSYARGDASLESDVDLRIDKGEIRGLFSLASLLLALEERLGVKVDLLTTDSLDSKFLEKIKGEEILLYGTD